MRRDTIDALIVYFVAVAAIGAVISGEIMLLNRAPDLPRIDIAIEVEQ